MENFHLSLSTFREDVSAPLLSSLDTSDELRGFILDKESRARTLEMKELVKRLDRIQHLAKQKNYAEIEKLLRENYV